jgi:hypothetical protein
MPSRSAVGAGASGGTGVCADGNPSPTGGTPTAAPSARPPSPPSWGGGAGGVGSDLIGAPGGDGRDGRRVSGGLTVPGGNDDSGPFRPDPENAANVPPRSETSGSGATVAR